MDCLAPITLKNGLCVPCGKCILCRSANRSDWSTRLQIHIMTEDRMPMFITLTYDDMHLPYNEYGYPSLHRPDFSAFLKEYKRKYSLTNDRFTYFGCGEYGENYRRPHGHLLLFGDDKLYNDFFEDEDKARKRITDVWKNGFVHVCLAGFDGVHYVTKYVLKEDLDKLPDTVKLPFTIASNNLGMRFLKTDLARQWKAKLDYLTRHIDDVMSDCPAYRYDSIRTINEAILYFKNLLPSFRVILDDGRTVYLPRPIRRKLVGSFEHYQDNPLWLYQHLTQLKDSVDYYRNYSDYDHTHDVPMAMQKCLVRVDKITKRLLEKKYNSKFKVS